MARNTDVNDPNVYVLYRYHPSLAAAALFVALFGLSTLLHCFQMWRKRSWFMTPFIIGGVLEMIGYIGRIISSNDQFSTPPYILQTLTLLVAPALLAASIYMILGRIILLTDGEKYAPIRRTWLTKVFVGGDVISFLMQGAGGGIMGAAKGDESKVKLGENIIIGGLFTQLFFFGFFVIASAMFQTRGRDHFRQAPRQFAWRKHLYVLYGTSTLILIRSVFRVVEYLQGNAGYLLRHEVFLYVFDAVLMFGVLTAMNAVHPGDIAIMLAKKNERERIPMSKAPRTENRNHESESGYSSTV